MLTGGGSAPGGGVRNWPWGGWGGHDRGGRWAGPGRGHHGGGPCGGLTPGRRSAGGLRAPGGLGGGLSPCGWGVGRRSPAGGWHRDGVGAVRHGHGGGLGGSEGLAGVSPLSGLWAVGGPLRDNGSLPRAGVVGRGGPLAGRLFDHQFACLVRMSNVAHTPQLPPAGGPQAMAAPAKEAAAIA